jgi:hypothetical protein
LREGAELAFNKLGVLAPQRRNSELLNPRPVTGCTGWNPAAGIAGKHHTGRRIVLSDLFTAETPLGTYQGFTDQVVLSRTPGAFRTVLVPRGSGKPEWLA